MTAWPANDRVLGMVTKYIGEDMAYAKLERMAIVAEQWDVPLRAGRVVCGEVEYGEALRGWDPCRELMPVRGYSA